MYLILYKFCRYNNAVWGSNPIVPIPIFTKSGFIGVRSEARPVKTPPVKTPTGQNPAGQNPAWILTDYTSVRSTSEPRASEGCVRSNDVS